MLVSKYPLLILYNIPKGISLIFCLFLAITFEPEMLECQSTPLKTRTTTWFPIKFQVKKLALAVGTQGLIILSKYA